MSELKYGVAYVNGLKYGFAYAYVCAVFTPSWTEALGSAQCQFSLRGIERPKQGTFLSLAGNLSASSTEKVLWNKICHTQAHALFTQPSLLNLWMNYLNKSMILCYCFKQNLLNSLTLIDLAYLWPCIDGKTTWISCKICNGIYMCVFLKINLS